MPLESFLLMCHGTVPTIFSGYGCLVWSYAGDTEKDGLYRKKKGELPRQLLEHMLNAVRVWHRAGVCGGRGEVAQSATPQQHALSCHVFCGAVAHTATWCVLERRSDSPCDGV